MIIYSGKFKEKNYELNEIITRLRFLIKSFLKSKIQRTLYLVLKELVIQIRERYL